MGVSWVYCGQRKRDHTCDLSDGACHVGIRLRRHNTWRHSGRGDHARFPTPFFLVGHPISKEIQRPATLTRQDSLGKQDLHPRATMSNPLTSLITGRSAVRVRSSALYSLSRFAGNSQVKQGERATRAQITLVHSRCLQKAVPKVPEALGAPLWPFSSPARWTSVRMILGAQTTTVRDRSKRSGCTSRHEVRLRRGSPVTGRQSALPNFIQNSSVSTTMNRQIGLSD
jgi:hypothetical protein